MRLFRWDRGSLPDLYGLGWWTGPDGDLLCVRPEIEREQEAELSLSPLCRNPVLAFLSCWAKLFLLKVDYNISRELEG